MSAIVERLWDGGLPRQRWTRQTVRRGLTHG
jgi:hypothetical protein